MANERVIELYTSGHTYQQIADETGLSFHGVKSAIYRYKAKQKDKTGVEYQDIKVSVGDPEALFDSVIAMQAAMDELDTKQVKLSLKLGDGLPVAIGFWGDLHLGGKGTDHKRIKEDTIEIADTQGFYYINMGDTCNFGNLEGHHRGEQHDEILNASQQLKMADWIFERTKAQCLGIIRGCHPDRLKQLEDMDIVEHWAEIAQCANLWHGADIRLTVGSVEYRVKARHKYKYESSLNTTNAQRRQIEVLGDADISALAHLHFPDVQEVRRFGHEVVMLRSGTYKIWDEYGQKLAGYKGQYGIPVVILFPNVKKMVPFRDWHEGLRYLAMVRKQGEGVA